MAERETREAFGYFDIVWRHKRVVLGCLLAAGIASAIVSFFFLPTLYRGTVTFVTKPVTYGQRVIPDYIEAYVPLLQDEKVVAEVIKQTREQGIVTDISPSQLRQMGHLEEVQEVTVFELRVECSDPNVAASLANIWADLFVAEAGRQARESALKVEQGVGDEIKLAQEKLKRAQEELNQFCALHYVREPENAFGTVIRTLTLERRTIESLANELEEMSTRARMVGLLRQELESFLATHKDYSDSNEKAPFDDLLFLESVYTRYVSIFGQTGQTVNMGLPARYADLSKSELFQAAQRMVSRFATTIKLLEADREKVRGELGALQKQLPINEAKLQELSRAVNDAAVELQYANARLSKVKENYAVPSTDPIAIESRAFVSPLPVAPKKSVNIIIASALGLVVGLGIAFLAELADHARRFAR